ncbi:MAG: ABC transporter permease subunit [Desulfurococcales archaeon]|jgi:ABC-type dipeptide/oligopeptide/nickel transport system permease subunit|nr:ABC transporter permease subunit [Desulfurococcales archaeon]
MSSFLESLLTPQNKMLLRKLRRNKNVLLGGVLVLIFIAIAILSPIISPYSPTSGNLSEALRPPSSNHPFGTDYLGRDILSRVIWGARISLVVAVGGIAISILSGAIIGGFAGYIGGAIDDLTMGVVNILLAFPDILLALFVAAVTGPGLENVILAIGVYNFPQFARIARGAVISVKTSDYVEAARASGETKSSIFFRYVLPNSMSPIVVHATLRTAASILTAAGLSFLGLGVQPPTPEWGAMISEALYYLDAAPYMWVFPGIFLVLTVLGFNLLGDGLNDVLNPRIKD